MSQCWDMSLEARICALKLEFVPRGWDTNVEASICGQRVGFEPPGWNLILNVEM